MINPIITWLERDTGNNGPKLWIFCLLKANQSLNREQSQSALPCHHVILVTSIAVAGDRACKSNCARQASSTWRQRRWSCSDRTLHLCCTLSFPKKMASSTQLWYIRACLKRSLRLSVGSPTWLKVWPGFKRQFALALMTWLATHVWISNLKRRC